MKRRRIRWVISMLLFGMLFGCTQTTVAPQTGATPVPTAEPTEVPIDPIALIDEAEIRAGKHEREEGYKDPFKTHYIDTAYAAVHLMDGESYSDEALKAFAKAVVSDILTLRERTGETTGKVTVYIIPNLLVDRPVTLGDHMICSTEQTESGAYREALIGICYELKAPWKQAGLSEIVFGTPDDSGLIEYYADETHTLTASCAAVYFLPEVAGEETADTVRKTAVSMTQYLLENGGMEALRETVSTAEILPEWKAQLGIETPITLPTGCERTANMTAYRDRTPRRVCVLQIENFTVRVNEDGPAGTADELYTFACQMLYGLDLELQMIRKESPIFAETADRRAKEPIVITLADDPTQSKISTGGQYEINLVSRYAVWHEFIHALLWTNGSNTPAWMQEGLAEHFSRGVVSTVVAEPEANSLADWFPADIDVEGDALAFWEAAFRVYEKVRREDETVASDLHDDWAYRRALAVCELLLPYDPYEGYNASVNGARGEKDVAQATDGNGLSYEEAMVMLEYLFDVYGTDTIADGMMNNRPLSETCGKDYPELFQDCIAYLRETYGPLLAE